MPIRLDVQASSLIAEVCARLAFFAIGTWLSFLGFPANAKARCFFEGSYLITGSAQCVKSIGDADRQVGERTFFLVAITTQRALIGYSLDGNGQSKERFRFVASHLPSPIGLSLQSAIEGDMLNSRGRNLEYVLLSKGAALSTHARRLDAIEVAAFSEYPLALFFASSYFGVGVADVAALLGSPGEEASSDYPCGTLSVVKADGESLRQIGFSQESRHRLTARSSTKRLADYESPLFAGGLVRVSYSTVFVPPLSARPAAPWTALATCERVGANDNVTRGEYRVTVTKALYDDIVVEHEIDAIIGLIPEGEEVQSSDGIAYVWEHGKVVRRIDSEAIARTRRLRFAGGGPLPIGLLVVSAIVAGALLVVHTRRKSKERA